MKKIKNKPEVKKISHEHTLEIGKTNLMNIKLKETSKKFKENLEKAGLPDENFRKRNEKPQNKENLSKLKNLEAVGHTVYSN